MSEGCSAREPYALRVLGDSMAPEFWDGCIVIIEPGAHARDGSFVVVDYRGDTLFRQLRIEGERRVLKPLNDQYPSIELDGEYSIRGIVVQRAGRRRAQHKHYD
ncbi:MAG TPA: S24 family peptidase [Acidiferrobacterales bacterium]|jgi:SOS-response transcriptional repressor LexA